MSKTNENAFEERRVLSTGKSIMYSLAAFGIMLPVSLLNGFSYYYMVYVVGFSPFLTSIGNSLGLFMNAFIAPFSGYLSDRTNPKKMGRRRPFMLYGTPFMVLSFFFMWYWPDWMNINSIGTLGVAIIYWSAILIFSASSTYVFAPYQAMLSEISNDEENRIMISGYQAMANLIGTIFGIVFPFIIKGIVKSNEELMFWMIIVAVVTDLFSVLTIYLTFFTIHEPIEELCKKGLVNPDELEYPKMSMKEVFADMLSPLKNEEFRKFQWNNFIFFLGIRIPMTILLPLIEVVLLITDEALIGFLMIVVPFALAGFILWTKISAKNGLLRSLKLVYKLFIPFLYFALIFLIPMPVLLKQILGLIIISIVVMALVGVFILPNPLISEIIDKEIASIIEKNGPFESEDEKYQFAGKFFGVQSFMLNLAGALAFPILGGIMEINKENPVLITILLPISATFIVFAYYFLTKMKDI